MADLGTLTITLGVNAQGLMTAETQVKQFAEKVKKTATTVGTTLQEPFALFSKSAISHLAMTSQRLRTFGYLASATVTAPLVLAGKSMMKMASEYEYAIQKIVGLTGTAQGTVNQWSKDIQNMAKEFGRRPQELAEGLYFIASSGIEGAEALDVLRLSAKAAASGLGETQVVANYLTSVLNAYRGTGLTAAYATDVLVAAVREGKAEATGFASAVGSITPLSSNLGVSLDQVAGAMAAITLTGSTSAQAATYLRGVFNVLMKETKQGTVAMDEASQALGQMKTSYADLRKILREQGIMALMQKLNELSAAYGETLVSKVFPNIRAMLGVLSLSGKNMQYNSKIIQEITHSQGSLGKAFAAVADTIKIRYDRAIASTNISMIELGKTVAEALLPTLEWLAQQLNRVTQWFSALSEEQKQSKIRFLLILAALGPVSMALSILGYTLTGLLNVFNGVGKIIIWLTQSVNVLATSFSWAALKATTFGKGIVQLAGAFKTLAVAILATPIGWFNMALGASVAFMYKKVSDLKAQIKEMQGALDYSTPAMDLDKQIGKLLYSYDSASGKYVSNLNKLTNSELSTLQTAIEQRLTLAKEDLQQAEEIGKKRIENDKEILKQREIIAKATAEWENYQQYKGNYSSKFLAQEGSRISLVQQTAEKVIESRKAEIKYNITAGQSNVKYYTDLQKTVDAVISKRAGMGKAIDENVAAEEKEIIVLQNLRTVLDQLADSDKALKAIPKSEYLKALGMEQLAPAPKMPLGYLNRDYEWDVEEREKIMNKLATTLKFVAANEEALAQAQGTKKDLYNEITGQVNAYSTALRELLQVDEENRDADWFKSLQTVTEGLKTTQQEFAKLEKLKTIANTLTQAFEEFFRSTIHGFKDFGQNILNMLEELIIKIFARFVVLKLLELFTGKKYDTLQFLMNQNLQAQNSMVQTSQGPQYAKGGIVPAGYPNDTYQARLSSGEAIIPLSRLNYILNGIGSDRQKGGEVVFRIEGDTLVGILGKQSKRNSIY